MSKEWRLKLGLSKKEKTFLSQKANEVSLGNKYAINIDGFIVYEKADDLQKLIEYMKNLNSHPK